MRPVGIAAALLATALAVAAAGRTAARVQAAAAASVDAMALDASDLKLQGLAWQRAAVRRPDLVPIYGSSELNIAEPDDGMVAFAHEPTGFALFTVGRAGTGDLFFALLFGALGRELRDKRLVLSISPPWFYGTGMGRDAYAHNFSALQADAFVFDAPLSLRLKEAVARRLLDYPTALDGDPVLRTAVRSLADGSPARLAGYWLLLPLGRLEVRIGELRDYGRTGAWLRGHAGSLRPQVVPGPPVPGWQPPLAAADAATVARADNNRFGFEAGFYDRERKQIGTARASESPLAFMLGMDDRRSAEWTDLGLALETLRELGAQPLVYTMPMPGPYAAYTGLPSWARTAYYGQFDRSVAPYPFAAVDFHSHDGDPYFLIDVGAHLSPRGWAFLEQDVDLFVHGQLHGLVH